MGDYVIIRGPLAVGKSSVAKMLASELDAEYISYDEVVDNPDLITVEKEEGYISQKTFLKANDIIYERVKEIFEKGGKVVFDGNFYWKSTIEDLISRVGESGRVFTLRAPVEVCIERDKERGETHGEGAVRVVHSKTVEFDCGDVIETEGKSVEDVAQEIRGLMR